MARKSISQTEQQECKLAENANNKRKWEGNHNGQCTVKGENCKKVGHMTQECRNSTAARNQRTHTCYNTLSERQVENKRKLNNTSKDNQNQQQSNKRQNTGKAYAAGHREKKYYGGSKPSSDDDNDDDDVKKDEEDEEEEEHLASAALSVVPTDDLVPSS
ncbi:hypothetical protein Tco_1219301 [Tanacetum coccineum]